MCNWSRWRNYLQIDSQVVRISSSSCSIPSSLWNYLSHRLCGNQRVDKWLLEYRLLVYIRQALTYWINPEFAAAEVSPVPCSWEIRCSFAVRCLDRMREIIAAKVNLEQPERSWSIMSQLTAFQWEDDIWVGPMKASLWHSGSMINGQICTKLRVPSKFSSCNCVRQGSTVVTPWAPPAQYKMLFS